MRECTDGPGNQADHQGQRDHEVGWTSEALHLFAALMLNREDDTKWPQKNKDGRQELEIRMGGEHISFEVRSNRRKNDIPC